MPKPINFFFLACICFYFLCICLRIRPYAAIIGSLGFAYCSFSVIITTAGHDTEMLALAYAPAVIGSVILLFDRKYLLGGTTAALFTALQIGQGHQQVSYYLFLVLIIMAAAFIIRAVRLKQTGGLLKMLGIMLIAGITGVAVNAINLVPAYDYAKESKRGGQLVMNEQPAKGEHIVNGKTTGLSKEYAFQWSYGRAETMSLMFPGVMGYGRYDATDNYAFPRLKDDSHIAKLLSEKLNVGDDQATGITDQMSAALYWGDQPFTNGPVYLGAVICFLFIFGMFYLDGKHKWWILTASVFGIILSWGSHFDAFNSLMFNYFPLYNKFRVPTMALVIPQMLVPIVAALTVNKLWLNADLDVMKKFKYGLAATALLFIIAFGFYMSSDFSAENKERTAAFNQIVNAASPSPDLQNKISALLPRTDNEIYEGWMVNLQKNPDAQSISRDILSALRKDRASLFLNNILVSMLFVLLAAGIIFLYLRNLIRALLMAGGLTLISTADLLILDSKYLNENSFQSRDNYDETEFPLTNADNVILNYEAAHRGTSNDRVFNAGVRSPFEDSKTSYYHNSIGGYHAAKLGIYDDLSTYQLSGENPNQAVLNMLNEKWKITGYIRDGKDLTVATMNPDAAGDAWFIKGIRFVNGPVAEMRALDNLDTKDSAVADEQYRRTASAFTAPDSSDRIEVKSFDNDAISYESNTSSIDAAVFSEIYYKDWKAYIDDKPAPYFKVNYVLRAMIIPAGKHRIDFKFEPAIFFASKKISAVASWLLCLLLPVAIFFGFRKKSEEAVG